MRLNDTLQTAVRQALSIIGAIVVAILIGLFILALDGKSPGEALSAAYWGSLSTSYRAANTLARVVIIVLAGLAAAVPFSAGIWNIGGDGQLTVGAFAAAFVGFTLTGCPKYLHLPLVIGAAMLAGALWAAIPAYLRLRFKANEIVTTIMMNYLAELLTQYLVNYPYRAPGSPSPETVRMPSSAILTNLVPLSNLNAGIFLAVLAFLLVFYLMRYTVWGYEWRVLGTNEAFARYGGVRSKRMRFLAMCLGGALAGLAGGILVLGVYRRFLINISGGIGFTGVLIALITANSPILVLVIAGIFAFLDSSVVGMEGKLGVAVELSDILQSVIIFLVIVRERTWEAIVRLFGRKVEL